MIMSIELTHTGCTIELTIPKAIVLKLKELPVDLVYYNIWGSVKHEIRMD